MKITKYLLITISIYYFLLCMTSCSTLPKTVYFQGDTSNYLMLPKITPPVVKIKSNDILAVSITTINEETNKLFDLPISGGLRYTALPNTQIGGMGMQPLGYEVDSSGSVDIPLIGRVKVGAMSCSEASTVIQSKLNELLKNPTVNVRILNHKFTILGEVNKPATYNILDNNLSVVEAIGMAGDLTIYGRRDNITLVRQEGNGARIKVKLNLLNNDILSSPYFFIRNGDVIYVEPSDVKSTYNDRSYQMLPIITSIISAVTALGVLTLSLTK